MNIWRSAAKFRPSNGLADTFRLKYLHFSYFQIFSNANFRTEGTPVAALFFKFPVSSWSDEAEGHNPQLGNFRCNATVYWNTWGVKDALIRDGYVRIWKKIMLATHLEDCQHQILSAIDITGWNFRNVGSYFQDQSSLWAWSVPKY
jgi:hypothetical protein